MESISFGIELAQKTSFSPEIIEIAAVCLDETGTEKDRFESLVLPGADILAALPVDALGSTGISREALAAAPAPAEAAGPLRAFLEAHKGALLHAFNLPRAKKLLGEAPWNVPADRWGKDILEDISEIMEAEGVALGEHGLRLYDAAAFFRLPIPPKNRALPHARVSAEILGKMQKLLAKLSDTDFLTEARYLMEDGF